MSETSNTSNVVHRSRKRRLARWLLVTILSSFGLIWTWNLVKREVDRRASDREYAASVAEADRDDPDWRWDRLNAARNRPPEGKNGAELIPRIKKLTHADWGKWQANEEWKSRLDVPPNVRYSPLLLAEAQRDLAASADAVALARTLKDYPFGYTEIILTPNVLDTLIPHIPDTRTAADLLRWDIAAAIETGDIPRAITDLHAMLNASRSIGNEPFLISQVVRIAVRNMAVSRTEWLLAQSTDPPNLAELQAEFETDADEPLLLYGLRGDRAVSDRLFENLETGVANPNKALDWTSDTWAQFAWWNYRPTLRADRAVMLAWMTRYIGSARLPIHEQPPVFATIPTAEKDPKHILSGLLMPAVERVSNAFWRSTAEERCAAVGIACERFRRQHNRWPGSLTELVPTFLKAVPIDPYTGESLRYAKLETGLVVYSQGKRLPLEAGLKIAPVLRSGWPDGIEIGFQLWNPDQRRLSPPPDPPQPEREPPP